MSSTAPDPPRVVPLPSASPPGTSHAHAGLADIVRLGATLGAGRIARGADFDAAAAGCAWARAIVNRDRGAGLDIAVPGVHAELVTRRERSEQVLATTPGPNGYAAGKLKAKAMSFLAERALTIADGDTWARLRRFNERVLGTGGVHPFAQTFLEHVRAAFAAPVGNTDDIRAAMGRAMVGIVLGEDANVHGDPAGDVRVLFDVVQSPLRRLLLGFWYKRRRKRLYEVFEQRWAASRDDDHTLLARARGTPSDVDHDGLLQQVPHWMFTFTGSGSDLLARTLAMVTSRPNVHRRVLDEIGAAGDLGQADSLGRLPYLNACVLETGRLFPPVTRTFHRPPTVGGSAASDIVHYFPLLQRDDALGPSVHEFRPERWLGSELDAAATASNLFLRGPRACPGMDLILFVCRAAGARLLAELRIAARSDVLSRDPLPVSFPEKQAHFTVSETSP
jgi:cytochrome P450